MDQEIGLQDIVRVLLNNWIIVLVVPLIMAVVTAVILFKTEQPKYTASTTLLVLDSFDPEYCISQEPRDVQRLYATYAKIVTSKRILKRAIADLGTNITAEQLQGKTSVSYFGESNIMTINVNDSDPQRASRLANQIAETYILEINDIVKGKNIRLLDEAVVPLKPDQTRKHFKIIVAAAAGLVAAVGLVFIRECFLPIFRKPLEKAD